MHLSAVRASLNWFGLNRLWIIRWLQPAGICNVDFQAPIDATVAECGCRRTDRALTNGVSLSTKSFVDLLDASSKIITLRYGE